MQFRSVGVGLDALGANPLRTLLSTSGVVIGVASLVAVLSLGDGIERFARAQIENTTDLQYVEVTPRTTITVDGVRLPGTTFPRFTPADADALAGAVDGVAQVRLVLTGSGRFAARDTARAAIIHGSYVAPETTLVMRSGRSLSSADMRGSAKVAMISERLAAVLGGDSLTLAGERWSITGVMPAQGRDSMLRIIVPLNVAEAAMVPSEWPRAPTLLVRAARIEDVEHVRAGVERWLESRDRAWRSGVAVNTNTARVEQARQGALVFKLFMGAITGISLLVGGIGIMNVLLASVAERTREIGIRKATGARSRDVLVQFLAESVTITGVGSVIGVALGLGGAFAVTAIIRAQTRAPVLAAFTWGTVAVAVGAAVAVGIAFGTYPALRAARLSPIDAIRHE